MNIRSGYKYQVSSPETFKLPEDWPDTFRMTFENNWFRLTEDYLTLKIGYAWNGANGYPDYYWIKVPSAIHDAMLQSLWVWSHTSAHGEQPMHEWPRDINKMDKTTHKSIKRRIDVWFTDLALQRMPKWRRLWTRTELLLGVNRMSKYLPGSQALDHRIEWYD